MMIARKVLAAVTLAALVGAAPMHPAAASGDARFQALARQFLYYGFRVSPPMGSQAGVQS